MDIFPSIEDRAGRIPDGVERLRFLRRKLRKRRTRSWSVQGFCGGTVILLAWFSLSSTAKLTPPKTATSPLPYKAVVTKVQPPPRVWVVEQKPAYVVYSNSLQIRTEYLTGSEPRSYHLWERGTFAQSPALHTPAGIVFHTTESPLVPLEPSQNASLVRTREDLLRHVQQERCYNLVIDRFGQVFQIVPDNEVAFHAGHSVWADAHSVYVNLNESFLGVAFEERTEAPEPSVAQLRSARLLTEMLRSRYAIPEADCVTHAQVSVNPDNMRIGYHTDWAARFPFQELGLNSGYALPVAAIAVFGFEFDSHFLDSIGGHPWEGVVTAENQILQEAAKAGSTPANYRQTLQQRYRALRRNLYERTPTSNRT